MSTNVMVAAVVFFVLALVLGLLILIDCIRYRKAIKLKYGMLLAAILVALDCSLLLLLPGGALGITVGLLIPLQVVVYVRTMLVACMGMYCCSVLGIPDLPLVKRLFGRSEARQRVPAGPYVLVPLAVTAGAVLFSYVLFTVTQPEMSETLKRMSGLDSLKAGAATEPTLLVAVFVLVFAYGEEVIYRLGVQNYLAMKLKLSGRGYWVAVVLTAALWTLGHVGTLEPWWVKLVQVFPLGLALGFMFKRFGLEACVLVHGAFNVVMMLLAPSLFGS